MEYSPKERGILDYYRLVYLVIPLWSQCLLSDFQGHAVERILTRCVLTWRGTAPPFFGCYPPFSHFLLVLFIVTCVCVCVIKKPWQWGGGGGGGGRPGLPLAPI